MRLPVMIFTAGLLMPALLIANIIVAGTLTREFTGAPGEVFEGVIELENPGETVQEARLYLTDFRYQWDGKTLYGDPKENPRSDAGWIQYSPERIMLQAGEKGSVLFRIQIPPDSALTGTYWCMMMVEPVLPIDPESFKENQFSIRSVTRFGIQIRVHIGDTGTRQMRFLNVELVRTDERRFLRIDIENTGERRLDLNCWVDLYNTQGTHRGKFSAEPFGFYPGTSLRKEIDLTGLEPGEYKALIIADGGEDALFGVNYTLKIE